MRKTLAIPIEKTVKLILIKLDLLNCISINLQKVVYGIKNIGKNAQKISLLKKLKFIVRTVVKSMKCLVYASKKEKFVATHVNQRPE